METDSKNSGTERFRSSNSGRAMAGLVLVALGGVWLAHEAGLFIPDWVLSPFMIPIVIGVFIGAKRMFRPGFWMFFILVGVSLILFHHYDFNQEVFWPMMIIVLGLWMIIRPKREHRGWKWDENKWNDSKWSESTSGDSRVDANSVFGGTKKKVVSKDFKGGEINSVFGGNDLDLTQADINGTAVLNVNVAFGGVKLVVPSHWRVQSDIDCAFGSVEDKRKDSAEVSDKTLILKGSVVFGGIEIKSY